MMPFLLSIGFLLSFTFGWAVSKIMDSYGMVIEQKVMIYTLLAFSVILLLVWMFGMSFLPSS
jgi:hypothetical protein